MWEGRGMFSSLQDRALSRTICLQNYWDKVAKKTTLGSLAKIVESSANFFVSFGQQ